MIEVNQSFVNQDQLLENLREGVKFGNNIGKVKDDPSILKIEGDQSNQTPLLNLSKRRMTREQYLNVSTTESERYKEHRLKFYGKDASNSSIINPKEKYYQQLFLSSFDHYLIVVLHQYVIKHNSILVKRNQDCQIIELLFLIVKEKIILLKYIK